MTHTVHPYAHRLGIIRGWKSRWFSADPKHYRECVYCDATIRNYLKVRLKGMYVSDVEIERSKKIVRVIIKTSRPGLIIGRSGEGITVLKKDLEKVILKLKLENAPELKVDVEEVKSPESNASVVSQMVAEGLSRRFPFRRVLKQMAEKVMANRDVKGVRISIAGRLGGAEMSRREEIKKGRIPLQTFRADIDFARAEVVLPYGVIGIKVWIYKGEIFEESK